MKSKLKTMVGKDVWEFDIESNDLEDFWKMASVLTSFPKVCGNCNQDDLSFKHRSPKGNDYYSVDCKACGHTLRYGQHKEGGMFFVKNWEAPYQGDVQIPPTHDGSFSEAQQ